MQTPAEKNSVRATPTMRATLTERLIWLYHANALLNYTPCTLTIAGAGTGGAAGRAAPTAAMTDCSTVAMTG